MPMSRLLLNRGSSENSGGEGKGGHGPSDFCLASSLVFKISLNYPSDLLPYLMKKNSNFFVMNIRKVI